MTPGEFRIHLRAALSECKRTRGDSQEHLKACYDDCMQTPQEDWEWWLLYFQGEAKRYDGILKACDLPRPSVSDGDSAATISATQIGIRNANDAARQGAT